MKIIKNWCLHKIRRFYHIFLIRKMYNIIILPDEKRSAKIICDTYEFIIVSMLQLFCASTRSD